MILHPLPEPTQAQTGATHMAEVTSADLAALAAGNTGTVNLFTVKAGQAVSIEFCRLKTPFTSSDGTLLSLAATVGDGGNAARYLASYELLNAPAFIKGGVLSANALNVYGAADTVAVAFTATAGKNLNTATAGSLLVFLNIQDGNTGSAWSVS